MWALSLAVIHFIDDTGPYCDVKVYLRSNGRLYLGRRYSTTWNEVDCPNCLANKNRAKEAKKAPECFGPRPV